MKLRISDNKDLPTDQLDSLFKLIGWKPRGKQKWQKALEASSFVISVWDEKRIVGLGRILEDGVMCMFYDIGVDPRYQNKGVGKQIMEKLIDKIKDKGYASIGLFPWIENKSNIPFYEKHEFVKVTGMELERFMKRE